MAKKTYTTRPIDRLGRTLIVWLAINMVADALNAALAGADIWLISRVPNGSLDVYGIFEDPSGWSNWTAWGRFPVIIVWIVAGFLFLKWTYRANRNAHASASGLTTPPPWAVGWYFVPIALLWKPYKAMSETWRVSQDPANWKKLFTPDLLPQWWGAWIIGNILGQASFRIGMRANTVDTLAIATGLEAGSAIVTVICGALAIQVVRTVTARQTALISQASQKTEAEDSSMLAPVPS